jgi:hypothetical protein
MKLMMRVRLFHLIFCFAIGTAGISVKASEAILNAFPMGAYVLMESSHSLCSDGNIVHIKYEDEGQQKSALVIGSVFHVDITELGSESREAVVEGCTYVTKTEFKDKTLIFTLTSESCPKPEENSRTVHRLTQSSEGYSWETQRAGKTTRCLYKRGQE